MNDLTKELQKSLQLYAKEVEEEVRKGADSVSKEAVKQLKMTSPKRKNGGQYARGWRRKKDGNGYIIYNKDHYQLNHLLELGHDIISSDERKIGFADPIEHIKPVEEKVQKEFIRIVQGAVKQ